jgi:predicted regulator of Ras-like GTPase activity (Roadblock/LC7/MglB family)
MSGKNSTSEVEGMLEKLQGIKEQSGVIGYILKDAKTASVDLKDPTKIIDYANLSTTAFETANNLSDKLALGEITEIIMESEETKLVSRSTEDYQLSVFMETSVNHNTICKSLD